MTIMRSYGQKIREELSINKSFISDEEIYQSDECILWYPYDTKDVVTFSLDEELKNGKATFFHFPIGKWKKTIFTLENGILKNREDIPKDTPKLVDPYVNIVFPGDSNSQFDINTLSEELRKKIDKICPSLDSNPPFFKDNLLYRLYSSLEIQKVIPLQNDSIDGIMVTYYKGYKRIDEIKDGEIINYDIIDQ